MIQLPLDPAPAGFTWPGGAKLALSMGMKFEEGAERLINERDKPGRGEHGRIGAARQCTR